MNDEIKKIIKNKKLALFLFKPMIDNCNFGITVLAKNEKQAITKFKKDIMRWFEVETN